MKTTPLLVTLPRTIFAAVTLFGLSITNASAFELFNQDVEMTIFNEEVSLPLSFSASESAVDGDILNIEGEANVTDVLPVLSRQVKALIMDQNNGCKFRVSSSEPEVAVSNNAIHVLVTSTAEVWICTSFSKNKIVKETGTIIAAITPAIRNGALTLNLSDFEVHDLSKVSDMLGIEKQLKKKFQKLLNGFNDDPKLSQLPKVLATNGFAYSNVKLENTYRDRQTIALEVQGPNDALTLLKVAAALIAE